MNLKYTLLIAGVHYQFTGEVSWLSGDFYRIKAGKTGDHGYSAMDYRKLPSSTHKHTERARFDIKYGHQAAILDLT